jgi:hypothetical protein
MLDHSNCSLAEAKELSATSIKNNRYWCGAFCGSEVTELVNFNIIGVGCVTTHSQPIK